MFTVKDIALILLAELFYSLKPVRVNIFKSIRYIINAPVSLHLYVLHIGYGADISVVFVAHGIHITEGYLLSLVKPQHLIAKSAYLRK